MASNYTSNYKLCQWQASDKVLRTEFNEDNAKIDAALATKAEISTVEHKAEQSALDTLAQTVASQGTELELRNCCCFLGSYRGDGTVGEESPNVLTFPQKPVFLCVTNSKTNISFHAVCGQTTIWHYSNNDQVKQVVSWGDRSVSWYNVANLSSATPLRQMNDSGVTYYYFAILQLD